MRYRILYWQSLPTELRVLTGAIFLVGIFLISFKLINNNDFLILITMDVLIVYTYYTYKVARISIIAPAMLEAQKSHMSDLRIFLQEWKDKMDYQFYDEYKELNIYYLKNLRNPFKEDIISNWKYNDLVENHLPDECKLKFAVLCEKFALGIDGYRNERNNLFLLIREDIYTELKNNCLDIKFLEDEKFKFIELCYQQYVSFVVEVDPFYSPPPQSYFSYNSEGTEINLVLFSHSVGHTLPVAKGDRDLRLDAQGKDTRPLENALREMLFSTDRANKYGNNIKKIIELYGVLEVDNDNISKIVDFLLRYPILPGTKCSILRHLYTNSQLEDFD
jgi:hypothetical protein